MVEIVYLTKLKHLYKRRVAKAKKERREEFCTVPAPRGGELQTRPGLKKKPGRVFPARIPNEGGKEKRQQAPSRERLGEFLAKTS